ncbi:MAG TPA: isoaspartyl peptidase/L-asparaginase [Rectinemataceae bacterium]|nr:isoaspartyl peptidase/L-asparaginase [Rectinemataceae bacterium]
MHGGAWNIPAPLRDAHIQGVRKAYRIAHEALASGMAPLRAVVEVLKSLEDDPTFDAGTGSFLNEDGRVELDAAVMEGADLGCGAVAAVGRFRNPSEIALAVKEKTDHVLLIAEGAERFALAQGFETVEPRSLVHPREFEGYEAWVRAGKPDPRRWFDEEGRAGAETGAEGAAQEGSGPPAEGAGAPTEQHKRGTVGVVIGVRKEDESGYRLFSGISTGGTRGKMAGRVGDVPLIGCGIYADDETAAVCCTGWGEAFVRTVAAKSVAERIASGAHPQEAVEAQLWQLLARTGGRGGIMAVDSRGRMGAGFTTPDMAYAGPGCRRLEL